MIYADPSELKSSSLFRKHCNLDVIPLPGLEAQTGADLMIGSSGIDKVYVYENGIEGAINAGAILIQLKFGSDLLSSIQDGRISKSHLRMCKAGATPNQRWLLALGIYHTDKEGNLYVNSTPAYGNVNFQSYLTSMIGWSLRGTKESGFGGVAQNITNYEYIDKWLISMQKFVDAMNEAKMVSMQDEPKLYQDGIFGQELVELPKICETWASIDGIGAKMAYSLYKQAKARNITPSMEFFMYEVIDKEGEGLRGFGKGIAEKARKWLNGEIE